MLPTLRSYNVSSSLRSLQRVRSLATETSLPKVHANTLPPLPPLKRNDIPEGPLRPHLNVAVDPNHGLWAFFRKKLDKDGSIKYETVEPQNIAEDYSGRAWTAAELRRKSFKDLHVLWYVVLREQNLLATQLHELGRIGAIINTTSIKQHKLRCRKTMARIKYVINERRLAYEGAVSILAEQKESELAVTRERGLEKGRAVEETDAREHCAKGPTAQQTAAEMATVGVFDTIPSESRAPPKEDATEPREELKSKSDDSHVI